MASDNVQTVAPGTSDSVQSAPIARAQNAAPSTEGVPAAPPTVTSADATPLAYKGYLEGDARTAGVALPSITEMGKRLPYRVDDMHRGLSPGDPPVEIAGLRLQAVLQPGDRGNDLVLVIANPGDVDLAYDVVTKPSYGTQACGQRRVLSFDAMVVAHHADEKRAECIYRDGMVLGIERVETLALAPLQSYYVSRVLPSAVGLEPRLGQGHRPSLPAGVAVCNMSMSQSIRAGLEQGSVGWRDLVDFYARHRCDTYRFPDGYRAYTGDGAQRLPVVPGAD